MEMPLEEKILAGLFFCSNQPIDMLDALKPEWNKNVSLPLADKCAMLGISYPALNVFPWKQELSKGIDEGKFETSFFIQPDIFLRLRPGQESIVKQKLEQQSVNYHVIKNDCIALTNATRLDEVIKLNKEAVVQDFNSQKVGAFLPMAAGDRPMAVWDCCAASGGKSIMAKDILGHIDLTVSDIRESILVNLKKRFNEAGIKNYKSFVADLSGNRKLNLPGFDLIICDAPCTGSGTWSRTPEQLFFFEESKIAHYVSLQHKIVSNAAAYLKPGGYLLYITCSVFKKENEEVVNFINQDIRLILTRMETLKGYHLKADTLFAALLQKPL